MLTTDIVDAVPTSSSHDSPSLEATSYNSNPHTPATRAAEQSQGSRSSSAPPVWHVAAGGSVLLLVFVVLFLIWARRHRQGQQSVIPHDPRACLKTGQLHVNPVYTFDSVERHVEADDDVITPGPMYYTEQQPGEVDQVIYSTADADVHSDYSHLDVPSRQQSGQSYHHLSPTPSHSSSATSSGPSQAGGYEVIDGDVEDSALTQYAQLDLDPDHMQTHALTVPSTYAALDARTHNATTVPGWVGTCDGKAAAAMMQDAAPGTYAVRERRGDFAIAIVCHDGLVRHLALTMKDGAWMLGGIQIPAAAHVDLENVLNQLVDNRDWMMSSYKCQLHTPLEHTSSSI